MPKTAIFAIQIVFINLFLTSGFAQTDEEFKRFEVGVQFTHLSLREFDTVNEYYRQRGFRIEGFDKGQSELRIYTLADAWAFVCAGFCPEHFGKRIEEHSYLGTD